MPAAKEKIHSGDVEFKLDFNTDMAYVRVVGETDIFEINFDEVERLYRLTIEEEDDWRPLTIN
jgi:hypothetical protein